MREFKHIGEGSYKVMAFFLPVRKLQVMIEVDKPGRYWAYIVTISDLVTTVENSLHPEKNLTFGQLVRLVKRTVKDFHELKKSQAKKTWEGYAVRK